MARLQLDLHELFNRGRAIDQERGRVIHEAVEKKTGAPRPGASSDNGVILASTERRPEAMRPQRYAVLDFETTGMSPAQGARPTEIGIVRVCEGRIVDRYQSLMNPGQPIPYDIQTFTGITDAMVRRAPTVRDVMAQVVHFVGGDPIVAHNAAFDRKFWAQETASLSDHAPNRFLCSLLLARRLFPATPNHKLETLVSALGLPTAGRFHRALADAECTAHLFIRLQEEVRQSFDLDDCDCGLLEKLQATSKHQLARCVERHLATVD